MRSAVLDLGSQTFHAIVADVDTLGIRRLVFDRKVVARIGEHAYGERRIPRSAYVRGLELVGELIERTRPRAPEHFRVVATGVFRDVANGEAFLVDACERYGAEIELLDGREEARLAWLGISAELAGSHGCLAMIDLGGGSLQIAAGATGVELAHSLPLGVFRLRDLDPAAIQRIVVVLASHALDELRASAPDTLALASGTACALLGLARRLGLVSEIQRHVCARTFAELARRLAPLSHDALEELRVPAARRDTITAGAIAIATMLEHLGRPVVYVARSALREGALIDLAQRERAALPAMRVFARAG